MLNNLGFYILISIYYISICVSIIIVFLHIILCLVLIISIHYDMFVFSSQNAYINTRHFTAWGKQ